MNNLKKAAAALMALIMLFGFAACGGGSGEETTEALTETATSYIREIKTKIAALNGPVGFGLTKFSIDREYNYETAFYDTTDEVVALLKNGQADIATLPIDAAAKLYNETNGAVKILAVNSLGFFSVVEKGEKIKSIKDLKGKTVYAAYQGTAYENVINYIFEQNGINPEKNIDIQFKADNAEAAMLTDSGTAEILILPEPYASKVLSNNQEYRRALDINAEWNKISENKLVQSVVVARSEYIDANPDIIKEFVSYNKISINYLNTNIYSAPVFLLDEGFCETATLATYIIPASNLAFIGGEEMKPAVNAILDILNQNNPELIGGKIPDDGFYYGV
ncbi:MAG: ABC transporter substrate-binding protein [Clostridia bacterium]|nr:ABC transporter substrate-binding protein [Clostridia bacterium]MBQ7122938.1 ABC transporter substrate-binding protein [Clostridia bacterium]